MARGPCTFKQQDVTRALRATIAAGIAVEKIEIDRDGKIIVTAKPDRAVESRGGNEWDNL
jgi:hypothetical protein